MIDRSSAPPRLEPVDVPKLSRGQSRLAHDKQSSAAVARCRRVDYRRKGTGSLQSDQKMQNQLT